MSAAIPLPAIPAERSATFAMPGDFAEQLDFMLTLWLDAPDWQCRFALAEAFMSGLQIDRASDRATFQTEATMRIFTALLENLGERDITSLEQAAMYRLSIQPEHQLAARRWLWTISDEAFAAWMDQHPAWTLLAAAHVSLYPALVP
jgi:hypothetical protein